MYTDYLGKPINVGGTIVYPDQRGRFNTADVIALVPLVTHPESTEDHPIYARADQLNKRSPTRFTGRIYEDPAKRFVVQVMKKVYRWRAPSHAAEQRYTLPTTHALVIS